MKRLFCLIILILTLTACTACADSNTEPTQTTAGTSQPTETVTTTVRETTVTAPTTQPEERKFKILLDAGHGCTKTYTEQVAPGSDKTTVESPNTGTSGVSTNRHESELTLAIALKLQAALKKTDAEVYMVRSTPTTDMSLTQRAEMGNELGVDLVLRIHADGVDDSSVRGASLLYPSTDYTDADVVEKSKEAAECISQKYIEETELNDRGVIERNDLVGFNFTTVPSVLIELGFMSNPEEDELMWEPSFQQKMTDGIINGITEYRKRMKE